MKLTLDQFPELNRELERLTVDDRQAALGHAMKSHEVQKAWRRHWQRQGIGAMAACAPSIILGELADWSMWKELPLAIPVAIIGSFATSAYFRKDFVAAVGAALTKVLRDMQVGKVPDADPTGEEATWQASELVKRKKSRRLKVALYVAMALLLLAMLSVKLISQYAPVQVENAGLLSPGEVAAIRSDVVWRHGINGPADLTIQSRDRAVARRVTGKWVTEYHLVRVGPQWEIEDVARIPR